jgi:hypothetical protein
VQLARAQRLAPQPERAVQLAQVQRLAPQSERAA